MIKAIAIATTEVNKKRPGHEFASDSSTAESTYKTQIKGNEEAEQNNSKYGTIMVYEIYEKITEDNVTYIKKTVQIQDKDVEIDKIMQDYYPIIAYQPERFGGKLYPISWMDPIIELNKSMNRIYTSLEDWVHMFSKGRRLKKRTENVSNISDQNGQIIEYDNIPPSYMQA
ncbi:MAG: hypothetical protein GY861_00310 [bacterium]|nr:hypothetical protein [bacterium]